MSIRTDKDFPRLCTRCVLPETFPGISFDEHGVCSICQSAVSPERLDRQKERFRLKFEKLMDKVRDKYRYDCVVSYSGGKDSSYILKLMAQTYGLRVLAVTVDNGFVASRAVENIRTVVESLDIDLHTVKPRFGMLRKIFRQCAVESPYSVKALERASSICNSCMGIVKLIVSKTAIENVIPMAVYGWSPGQVPIASSVFKMSAPMILQTQSVFKKTLAYVTGDELDVYMLDRAVIENADPLPTNVAPLAFLDYDETNIKQEIAELGWRSPDDTDDNSSNCLLNSFANIVHVDQFDFHPYALEVAGFVRQGLMSRDEGIERTSGTGENEESIECVRKKLGLETA